MNSVLDTRAGAGPVIKMDAATMDFGNGAGIFDICLSLQPGTILGMIGPSGCGKTTLVRVLTGLYKPTGGAVSVFGKDPAMFYKEDKARIGYIPQQLILYSHLTAEENLNVIGGMYGLSPAQRREAIERLLEFVDLCEARSRLVNRLSGGMKRRLMLASALMHDPELIFADEPTAGLDPILRAHIWKRFRQLMEEGRTLIVTTQFVSEAADCDLVAVMRDGRILTVDTPAGLRRQAAGGEVIHIQVEPDDVYRAMEFLDGLPEVHDVEPVEDHKGEVRVTVTDASDALPGLLAALKDAAGIAPLSAEPRPLPFDEVFVRLVQQSAGQDESHG